MLQHSVHAYADCHFSLALFKRTDGGTDGAIVTVLGRERCKGMSSHCMPRSYAVVRWGAAAGGDGAEADDIARHVRLAGELARSMA